MVNMFSNITINAVQDCIHCGTLNKMHSMDGYTPVCPACRGTKRMFVTLRLSDLQALLTDGYVPSSGG